MAADNNSTVFGIYENLTSLNASEETTRNVSNNTGLGLNETSSQFGDLFTSQLAGSAEMSGMLMLAFTSFFLYKADAGTDTSAAVLLPMGFYLAYDGWLPFGQGIVYGLTVIVAGIAAFGFYEWAFR